MGWFSKLRNIFKGKDKDEIVIVSKHKSPSKDVSIPPKLEHTLEEYVSKYYPEGMLFLDPEEESCFVYVLYENKIEELGKLSLKDWNDFINFLKLCNGRGINLYNKQYTLYVNVSFSNLGERCCVLLFEGESKSEIKERKREAIQRVNRLKPATSLTHKNVENLMGIIKTYDESKVNELLDLLMEIDDVNDVVAWEEKKDVLAKIKGVLSSPLPRKPLVKAISSWLGVPYVDVELMKIDKSVARLLPEDIARNLKVILFGVDEKVAKIALWNPLDGNVVTKVKEVLGRDVLVYMSCEEDIRYELEKIYPKK